MVLPFFFGSEYLLALYCEQKFIKEQPEKSSSALEQPFSW